MLCNAANNLRLRAGDKTTHGAIRRGSQIYCRENDRLSHRRTIIHQFSWRTLAGKHRRRTAAFLLVMTTRVHVRHDRKHTQPDGWADSDSRAGRTEYFHTRVLVRHHKFITLLGQLLKTFRTVINTMRHCGVSEIPASFTNVKTRLLMLTYLRPIHTKRVYVRLRATDIDALGVNGPLLITLIEQICGFLNTLNTFLLSFNDRNAWPHCCCYSLSFFAVRDEASDSTECSDLLQFSILTTFAISRPNTNFIRTQSFSTRKQLNCVSVSVRHCYSEWWLINSGKNMYEVQMYRWAGMSFSFSFRPFPMVDFHSQFQI